MGASGEALKRINHMLNSRHTQYLLEFLIGLCLIVLLNGVVGKLLWRWDLTEEKRYSITAPTKALLRELPDELFVEVFLEGDINADFKRLQKAIKEMLDEFAVYSSKRLTYAFINPDQAESPQARNQFYRSLMQRGLMPTNIQDQKEGKRMEKVLFPGAIVHYGGAEEPVMLLKGNSMMGAQAAINQSIEGLEFELANAIRKLAGSERKRLALVGGHGEQIDGVQIEGMLRMLSEHYIISRLDLKQTESLAAFDACMWIGSSEEFSEQSLYKIDQYLMGGGKLLFFLDALRVQMDSISDEGHFAFPYETGLDNLFFRYGLRLERNLLQDVNSGNYPLVTGQFGQNPQIQQVPWPFYIVLNTFAKHPITNNMDAVYARFVSSIDTVKAVGVVKTPLISTSPYTRELKAPARVNFNDLRTDIVPEAFNKKHLPVAYLLEGSFTSFFKNKFLPEGVDKDGFVEQGERGKLILVGDANFVKNEVNRKNGTAYPLGLDPFSNTTYANDELLLNMLNYLTDEGGIILARTKEIKVRPLDKVKIRKERSYWQSLNLALPVVLLLIYGIVRMYWRKRRYGK
jgi:ABC-2 type transport system permease protein